MVTDELDRPGPLQPLLLTEMQCGYGEDRERRHPECASRAGLSPGQPREREYQQTEANREQLQAGRGGNVVAADGGDDLNPCGAGADGVGRHHLCQRRRRGQARQAGAQHRMHDHGRQESERGVGDRLREAGKWRHPEVAQAAAHERLEVPGQAQQCRHDQQHVDATAPFLVRTRTYDHDQQHREQHRPGDETRDVDQRRGV